LGWARDKRVSLLWGIISVNDETFYNIAPVCGCLFNKKFVEKKLFSLQPDISQS
jgi:hypothetical protein